MPRLTYGRELKIPIVMALEKIANYYNKCYSIVAMTLEEWQSYVIPPYGDFRHSLITDGCPDLTIHEDILSDFEAVYYGDTEIESIVQNRYILYKKSSPDPPVPPGPSIDWDETKINVMTLDENEEPTDTIVYFKTFDEVCDYMMSDNQKYWVHQGNQMNPIPSLSRWQFDGYDQLVFIDLYGQTEIPDSCFSGYSGDTWIRRITGLDGVVTIGSSAFNCQTRMEPFVFPSSLRTIGSSAFEQCELLTDIVIPEGVTILPDNVFYGCSGLISITLPSTLVEIEHDAFWRCTALQSITIPDSVTTIGNDVFADCDSLETIRIQKAEGSISGAPWGATNANIIWEG